MKPLCILIALATISAGTALSYADDDKDESGKRWKSAEKWEKEARKNYEKQRKRALKDMEKRWKEDDRAHRDQFGSQRYYSRDSYRQFDDDFDDDHPSNRRYAYRVEPDRRIPPPLPVPRYEERYEEIDPGYESPRHYSGPRYDSRPRYHDERYVEPYVEPYIEPRYYGRGQRVGESLGARIGGLIGGSEGASIGAGIGADIGAEVDRDRYRDGRW
jgi:hypothetical protein